MVASVVLASRKSEARRKKPHAAAVPIPITARTAIRTEKASVSHPTLPGFVERVYRAPDRIEVLARRKKFGTDPVMARRRAEASRIFLHCWEVGRASLGGTMDFDRVRAPALPGSPPIQAKLEAAEKLGRARQRLYGGHYRIIELVVCEDWDISEVAHLMKDHATISSKDVDLAGFKFREALDALADFWLAPLPGKSALRTYRPGESVPLFGAAGTATEPARTAHASRDKVRYSDD